MRIAAEGFCRRSSRHGHGSQSNSAMSHPRRGPRGLEFAGHPQPDGFERQSGGRHASDSRPPRQHREPIADREQLVELLGDHQHRGTGVAQIDQRLADAAARRRRRRPRSAARPAVTFGSSRISRPTMNFCRLPPDRLRPSASSPSHFTANSRWSRARTRAPHRAAHQAMTHQARRGAGQHAVVGQRHLRHRAAPESFLRDEAQPQRCGVAPDSVAPRPGRTGGPRRAALAQPLARECRLQLLLPVAGDPGDADDLAAVHPQIDLPQAGAKRILGGERQIGQLEADRARLARFQ